MAVLVFTNARVFVNAVDHSDHVRSVRLEYSADLLEDTTMGDLTHSMTPGLKNWTITVDYLQDFADNNIDEQLFDLIGNAGVVIAVRPVNAAISTANPEYTATGVLETHQPLGNSIGELATTQAVFKPGGASPALVRDVTP